MAEVAEQTTTGGFWALFGKISAVLTAAGTLVGIYLALNPTGPDLEARGDYNSYALPPDLIDTIKAAQQAQSWESLQKTLLELQTNGDEHDPDPARTIELAGSLEEVLVEAWPERFRYGANPYRGFWYFTIENLGSRIADDVVLDVPFSGVALVTGRDEQQEIRRIIKTVNLGSLRPGDSVAVALWSEVQGSRFDFSDVRLTHAEGVGVVSFPSSFYGLRAIVARNLYFIGLVSLLAVVWVGGILTSFASKRARRTLVEKEAEEPSEPR